MSELVGATCVGSGGIEETGEKKIFSATVSTGEVRGKLLMQYLVPHCWDQATGVSAKAEPTNHLLTLVTHKIFQFLLVDPTSGIMQKIDQRTCHNGLHI